MFTIYTVQYKHKKYVLSYTNAENTNNIETNKVKEQTHKQKS